MAEKVAITSLRAKIDEVERYISDSEKRLTQARQDLLHLQAALRLISTTDVLAEGAVYVSMAKLFPRGEVARLAKEHLAATENGTAGTRDIARYVIAAKGWDTSDRTLVRAVSFRVSHAMTHERRLGRVAIVEKRDGVNVWRMTLPA
jgi:hypothetical protein